MFGLLKLLAYGLFGYAIYEFIRGMTESDRGGSASRSGGGSSRQRNFREDPARANLTGPGRGTTVATEGSDGGSVRHTVGRGAVAQ